MNTEIFNKILLDKENLDNPQFIVSDLVITGPITGGNKIGYNIRYKVRYTSRLDSKWSMQYKKESLVNIETYTSYIRDKKIDIILE